METKINLIDTKIITLDLIELKLVPDLDLQIINSWIMITLSFSKRDQKIFIGMIIQANQIK